MKKPVIAVDIDDVLVESAVNIIDFYNRQYGTRAELTDYYNWNSRNWLAEPREVVTRINRYLESQEYLTSLPVREAIGAIKSLQSRYDLAIITGRPDSIEKATLSWLNRHFPDVFNKVILTEYAKGGAFKPKVEVCKEIGAIVLIDDHLEHVQEAAAAGIRALLFGDYPWNQAESLPKGVVRAKDWDEVLKILLPHGS